MITLTNSVLLKGLKENDYKILDKIYKTYLPKIISMVTHNKGTRDEARDVFQEGLVVVFNKVQSSGFEFTSEFYSYFYQVCKFIWLRQLKKKHRTEVTLGQEERLEDKVNIESELIEMEKRRFYKEKFSLLGVDCQSVLQSFFDGRSLKEIALKMGYTNEYVKRKKFKCKEKLVKLIKGDRQFSEYTQ
ncbi:sigma-70 family RNA polymerase sigma factor [Saprospiraceae bacterium]|jgi:RNA polymerase sigma factor (sigma-70 family)|nr:sigma-70 family RNA polymerase sigma factor [Saprospiraceae bacterium]